MAGQPALAKLPPVPVFKFTVSRYSLGSAALEGASMDRVLFELCGKDPAVRFSPFAWRIRLALARKGLPFRGEIIRYSDKTAIAPSGSNTIPVLKEGEAWIAESWAIARHLEEAYPDKPSLFGSGGEGFSLFVQHWVGSSILPVMFRLVCTDIYKLFDGADAVYFYETRSKRIGQPLEETLKVRPANLEKLKAALTPARAVLKERPYLSGEVALYPDYILFGAFQWARLTSPLKLQKDEPEIAAWFKRIAAAYDAAVGPLEKPPLLAA
jgi:glutathione S-transferase